MSFYTLPSTVMNHTVHKHLKAAYGFYAVCTSTSWPDFMQDTLIAAKNVSVTMSVYLPRRRLFPLLCGSMLLTSRLRMARPHHLNLVSCTFLDTSPTSVVPLIIPFLILSSFHSRQIFLTSLTHSLIWRPSRVADTPPLLPISRYGYCLFVADVCLCSEVLQPGSSWSSSGSGSMYVT